ncbi:hypothetical protein [Microbacterium sp. 22242]|uniref:hypothetical protein n=1 Tax=Microbacterium sp. 22242 TaxID=3453896 RepID=UPI003F875F37
MLTIAPDTAQGSWLRAEALLRCDSARERIERTIVDLRAIDDGCGWRAKAVDLLRAELERRREELLIALDRVGSIEAALREG